MKKNALTLERVGTVLLPIYTEPRADGTRVTDEESFAVDVIADVLIWAALEGGGDRSIDAIVESALYHARHEITHNPEQE